MTRGCSHLVFFEQHTHKEMCSHKAKPHPFVDYELKFDSHSHISKSSIACEHSSFSTQVNVQKSLTHKCVTNPLAHPKKEV